jgi:hypothetical protein
MTDTGLELYRQNLVTEIEKHRESFSRYPLEVEYDNRSSVDMQSQTNPFLSVEVMYIDGYQADLSNKPVHRIVGMLVLTAKTREGMGSSEGYRLLEHFYPKVQWQVLGGVRLDMAKMVRPRLVNGWWAVSATIPFHINKFPT